ncbi:MAG: hypothetical protein ING19_07330 [Azospirillum sp.]|nr:hypothetical protein [Azospirillum sp.]MCA3265868.1 hypothetical protein [Azospirillum sp.]
MTNILRTLKRATASPVFDQRRLAREFASAFPAQTYRVQIVPRVAGNGVSRRSFEHDFDGLIRLVDSDTLARANARGACIFLRPLRRDLVLLDDLPPHVADRLADYGFAPAAIIQSSPAKTNVILRIPALDPNPAADATEAGVLHRVVQRAIVDHLRELGMPADPAAARDLQVWRFPGFSNQKRLDTDETKLKYDPIFFARIRSLCPDAVAQRGAEFVERAKAEIEIEAEAGPAAAFAGGVRVPGVEAAALDGDDVRYKVIVDPAAYVSACVASVREAQPGGRNAALFRASTALFRISAGFGRDDELRARAGFENEHLVRRLADAAAAAGLESKEVASTVASAARIASTRPVIADIPGVEANVPEERDRGIEP